jgi:hypothetical protein
MAYRLDRDEAGLVRVVNLRVQVLAETLVSGATIDRIQKINIEEMNNVQNDEALVNESNRTPESKNS